ncbi:MAG: carotenoid oxygenase family protein, partial [Myxococcota bacterium]
IVLEGYFQENPEPAALADHRAPFGQLMAYVDQHSFRSKLHRWRFDLATGQTKEERVDDRVLEFGTFNQRFAGRPTRYLYSTTAEPGWFLFTGLVKHDLHTGASTSYAFGPGRYGSEAPFAPRLGATEEDDGYLVSFVTDLREDRSECVVLDARHIEDGPVARILLPHRIPSGTHTCWASRDQLSEVARG